MSLEKHATLAFAKQAAAIKERELNSLEEFDALEPISWDDFVAKYFDTRYLGHDLPPAERKKTSKSWEKGLATMLCERSSMGHFTRIIKPRWCHEITDQDRINFINTRLKEVGSGASV